MRPNILRNAINFPPQISRNSALGQRELPFYVASRYGFISQTSSTRSDAEKSSQKAQAPKPSTLPKNPSFGGASFKELGANRTVKIVVIVAISILGTMESIFWIKVLWAKFSPPPAEQSQPDEN